MGPGATPSQPTRSTYSLGARSDGDDLVDRVVSCLLLVGWDHAGMANHAAVALVLREGDRDALIRMT